MNHKPISKLHRLCSSSSQLATNNNLTPLRPTLHNKPQNTITSPTNCQSSKKLISQTLTLSNSTQSPLLYFFSIQFYTSLLELESFLNERCEFADSSAFVAEDVLCVCCADDDFCAGGGYTHFAA